MSELINKNDDGAMIRWKLLSGASVLALVAYVTSAGAVKAEDASRPPIWIELDGQFAQARNDQEAFLPPFLLASPFDGGRQSALQKTPPVIWDKSAKINFQPDGSDWILSAGIRYGKNGRNETRNQLTAQPTPGYYHGNYDAYQRITARNSENHTIVDFQAAKDVGLGGLGNSVVSIGVRFAQFNSQSNANVHSQPANTNFNYNRFYGSFAAKRKFSGIGPSFSWEASTNLAGNPSAGSLAFDWGVNGALLFGRQRVKVHHQTTQTYQSFDAVYGPPRTVVYQTSKSLSRSKNVTVPNFGAFAGISWRYVDAKVTLGYRADMFFNAMDGGIDARKSENRAFYGPYASISIGLGD